ncbi:hypothetical protein AYI70_g1184 [Smittium culicis]|uniref:Uncharacterized protein n=1 Tax=Smittium culicis TaxID=133412 RepID=A0A1R1YDK9_9FUNG|nr:hypothetical protein AYI70_g1184 [Smittium culicis]
MNIYSDPEYTCNSDSILMEEPPNVMERHMKSQSSEAAFHHKETVHGFVCTEAQECGVMISASLLRQYNVTTYVKKFGGKKYSELLELTEKI